MPGGRPRKMVPERTDAILAALRNGHTRSAAAALVDVHYSTMARMVTADAEFRAAVENAEAFAKGKYEQVVARASEDPKHWTAAAWWLERRYHAEYGRRDQVEVRIDMQAEVRKLASDLGMDEETIMAEVDAILGARA